MIARDLLTANDFIGVRAGLVRELGGDANRALILTRIFFRADSRWREAHEVEGQWWWRATYSTIADETGLSAKQVERGVKWLTEEGYIEAERFALEGAYDQTRSYRVLVESEAPIHLPESGDDSPPAGNVDSPNPGILPIQTVKELSVPNAFEDFWKVYPKKAFINNARSAWSRLAAETDVDLGLVIIAAEAYRDEVAASRTEDRFVKQASSWLDGGGWSAFVAEPAVVDIKEQRRKARREWWYSLTPEQRKVEQEWESRVDYARGEIATLRNATRSDLVAIREEREAMVLDWEQQHAHH